MYEDQGQSNLKRQFVQLLFEDFGDNRRPLIVSVKYLPTFFSQNDLQHELLYKQSIVEN